MALGKRGWRGGGLYASLAKNLDRLGGALGVALTLRGMQHQVGRYWLDLFCDDARGRIVIIENQFERTDHDHLRTFYAGRRLDLTSK